MIYNNYNNNYNNKLRRCLRLTHTVVTQAAVRRSRRSEDLTGETVFQLHRLSVDQNLSGARWRSGASRRVCKQTNKQTNEVTLLSLTTHTNKQCRV